MGFFRKLFGREVQDQPTALEATVGALTPGFMNQQVKKLPEDQKVPYALAMSVLLFAQLFARSLRTQAREMPEWMRPDWPYPYDAILVEAAAFYYFALMAPLRHAQDDADWEDDADEPTDPYLDTLHESLHLCATIVSEMSSTPSFATLVPTRVAAYLSTRSSKTTNSVDKFAGFILRAWNPQKDGRPSLELSGYPVIVQAGIASMPVAQIAESCRGLYDEKLKKPDAL